MIKTPCQHWVGAVSPGGRWLGGVRPRREARHLYAGLTSYHRLDEAAGDRASTFSPADDWTPAGGIGTTADGPFGRPATTFNGTDAHLTSTENYPRGDQAFSVRVCVRFNSVAAPQIVAACFGGSGWTVGLHISGGGDKTLRFDCTGDGSSNALSISTVTPAADTDYHIVAVKDPVAGVITLSVNDEAPVVSEADGHNGSTTASAMAVGQLFGATYLDGSMNEFAFFDRVISKAETDRLWNGGYPISVQDFVPFLPGFRKRKEARWAELFPGTGTENFPTPFKVAADSDVAAELALGGGVAFTGPDGETAVPVGLYGSSTLDTGDLVLRAKLTEDPEAIVGDTRGWLYYDADATTPDDKPAVVDNGYTLFCPLEEDPSGSAPQILDWVTGTHLGTSAGSMTGGDLVDAELGKGLEFDGSDDEIYFDSSVQTATEGATDGTLEAIIMRPIPSSVQVVGFANQGYDRFMIGLYSDGNAYGAIGSTDGGATGGYVQFNGGADTGWGVPHSWALRLRGGVPAGGDLFQDGASVTPPEPKQSACLPVTLTPFRIGRWIDVGYTTGTYDEVRMSIVARSDAWLRWAYQTDLLNADTFTLESEQAFGGYGAVYDLFMRPDQVTLEDEPSAEGWAWNVIAGNIGIELNTYAYVTSGYTDQWSAARAERPLTSRDHKVRATVQVKDNGFFTYVGVMARMADDGSFTGYGANIVFKSGTQAVQVHRWENGTPTLIDEVSASLAVDTNYDVELEVVGDTLVVRLDGTDVIDTVDPDGDGPLLGYRVGIFSYRNSGGGVTRWLDFQGDTDLVGGGSGSSSVGGGAEPTGAGSPAVGELTATGTGTVTAPTYAGTADTLVATLLAELTGGVVGYPGSGDTLVGELTATGTGTVTAPIYTGTADTLASEVTADAAGTHAAYAGTADTQLPVVTVVAAGTVTAPTYTGTADTLVSEVTAVAAGTHATYIGAADTAVGEVAADAAGTHTAPTYSGTADVQAAALLAVATGTHTAPTYAGTADTAVGTLTSTGVGVAVAAGYAGAADVTVAEVTVVGAGTHTAPTYAGTAAVTLSAVTATGTGTHTAPVYSGTADTQVSQLTAVAAGDSGTPTATGTAAPTLAALTATGTGTHTAPVYTGVGDAQTRTLTAAGVGGMYTGIFGAADVALAEFTVVGGGGVRAPRYAGRFPQLRADERLHHLPPGSRIPPRTVGLACRIAGQVAYKTRAGRFVFDAALGVVYRLRPGRIDWPYTTAYLEAVVRDPAGEDLAFT